MLIYDASYRDTNKVGEGLQDYLNGTVTMDAAPGDFNDEDHPRGKEGSGKGGQFVKSEKTKQKEDEVDMVSKQPMVITGSPEALRGPTTSPKRARYTNEEEQASEQQLEAVWKARNAAYEALGALKWGDLNKLSSEQNGELHNWNSGYKTLETKGIAGLEDALNRAESNVKHHATLTWARPLDGVAKTRPAIYKKILNIAKETEKS